MNLFELFVEIDAKDNASGTIAKITSGLGKGLATAAKIGTAAVGAATAGITALTKTAVDNYAEYEQLVGGVETLFKSSADKVREYAANAYKTAGMSANEYMSTVTSFSASLLQSLGGDTEAAAEYANQALTDMSDNANKMGTDMSLIQNAYQGFAKANYTMLDNLKLGYGGTQSEMQRLIEDASKLSDTVDAQDMSFANIVKAINVVQTEMGITGTTALEAGRTISGSVGAMKSALENLLTGLADGNADVEDLVEDLVTTIVGDGTESNLGIIGNILPAIETAIGGVAKLIEGASPKIIEILPKLIRRIAPSLISAATGLVNSVIAVLPDLLSMVVDAIIQNAPILITAAIGLVKSLIQGVKENYQILVDGAVEIVNQLAGGILSMLPEIIRLGLDLIVSLANGIAESLPTLIPTIIDVVLQIVETLTNPETLSKLLDAALILILALAEGLLSEDSINGIIDAVFMLIDNLITFLTDPENIMKVVDAAVQLVSAIADGLMLAVDKIIESASELIGKLQKQFSETDWAQLGKDIVNGIWNGLKNVWGKLTSWFTEKWEGLVGGVKDLLGIHSPSRVFASIGRNMALGVGEGWEDEFGGIQGDIDKSLSFDDAGFGIRSVDSSPNAAFGGTSIGNITINIDGAKYSDEQSLAAAIALEIQNMTDRRAAVYA